MPNSASKTLGESRGSFLLHISEAIEKPADTSPKHRRRCIDGLWVEYFKKPLGLNPD